MGVNQRSVLCSLTATVILTAAVSFGSQSPCRIASSGDEGIILDLAPGALQSETVATDAGLFSRLWVDGEFLTREIGHPALPTVRRLFAMPAGATPTVTVLDFELEETSLSQLGLNHPVVPAQPSYSRGADPADIYFRYDAAAYGADAFSDDALVSAAKSGTMRGVGVGALVVSPFRYNPVTGQLRIYRNIRVRITFSPSGPAVSDLSAWDYSPFFESAIGAMLNAPQAAPSVDAWPAPSDLTHYPVTYLIMAHEDLNGNAKLAELVAWKRQKGFNVITHYVASTNSIQTNDAWIEEQYAALSPKPSFLLIVGDDSGPYTVASQVNPWEGVSRSDLIYGVVGRHGIGNHIPSIYVGRFCVRTPADLAAQVDKTIWYEKGQFLVATPDLAYLTAPLGAAGYDASNYGQTHGNPQISYGWTHYFNAANGMSNAVHYLDPAAYARDSEIVGCVDDGVNLFMYTAHGANDRFDDPRFGISHVDGLGNSGKYPLVVGSCCLTASFGDDECFGEAWLNAPDRGAIGFIGATMKTTWNEDLVMGVGTITAKNNTPPPHSPATPGMFDAIMSGDYPTQAGMKHCGLMAVENFGGQHFKYWLSYHLLGDPSLMPFFGVPSTQTVSHVAAIAAGDTMFNITTTPGAYAAITGDDGTIYGAGLADAYGVASFPLSPIATDHVHLTVTAQNRRPYYANIPVDDNATPVHYVDASNASPQSPYTNWLTAATTIQEAVDVAAGGDTVWVSNGVYTSGMRLAGGQATPNRLVVLSDIHIESVNGADVTHIVGSMGTNAAFAGGIRCAYLADGMLADFTLTNGCAPITTTEAEASGGGVYMVNGAISNCVVIGSRAIGAGGGARGGTLCNSRVEGNHALMGGGADSSALHNCLVVGNRAASRGGGASRATLSGCTVVDNVSENEAGGIWALAAMNNSILYYNIATNDYDNYDPVGDPGTVQHSCVTPDPGGVNVITSPPQFVNRGNGNYRLDVGSPCLDVGHNQLSHGDSDLDGNARIQHGTVDMGAYESSVAPTLTPSIGLSSDGIAFMQPAGRSPADVTLEIHNQGDGTLAYALTTNVTWISVAPENGSSTGEVDDVTLSFDTAGLAAGSYTGFVAVACTNADNSPRTVEVVVTLRETGGTEPEPPPGPGVPSTHYVDIANVGNAVSPYTNWMTAAVSIQDAVDAASSNSTVWVADGVYDSGSRLTPDPDAELPCRVVITNGITLRSLNGPNRTHIVGASAPGGGNGNGAVRCVYLAVNATVSGFTIRDGHTLTTYSPLSSDPYADSCGGGVVTDEYAMDRVGMYANGGVMSNCVFTGNSSYQEGGATWGVNCVNCLFVGNTSRSGGATAYGSGINCTIADNNATWTGGGTYGTDLQNSIIYHNTVNGSPGSNVSDPIGQSRTNVYNCTTIYPLHSHNVTDPPRFWDQSGGNYRLAPDSPCLGQGNNDDVDWDSDLDGAPRIYGGTVDMGAFELGYVDHWLDTSASALSPATGHGGTPANQTFTVQNLGGDPMGYSVSSDVGWMMVSPGSGTSSGEVDTVTVHYYTDTLPMGVYTGRVTVASQEAPNAPQDVVVTLTINQHTFHVDINSTTAEPPYLSPATAASSIQVAIDAAGTGSRILVGDGVYDSGGRTYGTYLTTNRLVIDKDVVVESINGAAHTFIIGAEAAGGGCGDSAVRCVYMSQGTLRGFTLTNGHTRTGYSAHDMQGGGVYSAVSLTPKVEDCIIIGNRAWGSGGGSGYCTLERCLVTGNEANQYAGGTFGGTINNCLITGNVGSYSGGTANSALKNCTVTDNAATNASFGCGGAYQGTAYNSIIYYNNGNTPNVSGNFAGFKYICTTNSYLPASSFAVTNEPSFVNRPGGDYRLVYDSPCIDSGNNAQAAGTPDHDGNPRIQN
ncbi:MAG: hypothetical protein HN341_14320, partial [Verrucomicrobia bacterium]|nr:hypothetical protein [Verrucomicrobiota bacterium]